MKMLDLTHCITPEMPVYPGTEPPPADGGLHHGEGPASGRQLLESTPTPAPTWTLRPICCKRTDTGRLPGGDLRRAGLRGGLRGAAEITLPMLRRQEEALGEAEFLLFCTGWDRYWGQPRYYEGFPCLTAEAAEYVASLGLKGVGRTASRWTPAIRRTIPIT